VVVMAEGRIIAEGPPASISENSEVVDAYLGSSHGSELDFDSVEVIGGSDDADGGDTDGDSDGETS
ncbi:MAG: ABC transporter ATP-binding protein, partial [Actinomycetota bacterium]